MTCVFEYQVKSVLLYHWRKNYQPEVVKTHGIFLCTLGSKALIGTNWQSCGLGMRLQTNIHVMLVFMLSVVVWIGNGTGCCRRECVWHGGTPWYYVSFQKNTLFVMNSFQFLLLSNPNTYTFTYAELSLHSNRKIINDHTDNDSLNWSHL